LKQQTPAQPAQTFFIPMPEFDTFERTFEEINSSASGDVTSMIGIAVALSGTVIWYDHWEDGFETDLLGGSLQTSTEVWGDGICSNGSYQAAIGEPCTDDYLSAGQSIVIMDKFSHKGYGWERTGPTLSLTKKQYDGRDKVTASGPLAITRGMYPENPGSLMAGAVEVMDTSTWGTTFECPVGQDLSTRTSTNGEDYRGWDAYQHTAVYVMAGKDGTIVTFSSGNTQVPLAQGESYTHTVANMGETFTSNYPVQAHIVTGDVGSTFELRWYSLLPREKWAKSYVSPVGDTKGESKILLYNPNGSQITVTVKQKNNISYTRTVGAGDATYTSFIPDGTGAEVSSSSQFSAISVTDTMGSNQIFDWGFPLMPTDMLTSQVLIGWGYGCEGNDCSCTSFCNGGNDRSVVWITPVAPASIYVDYENDGIVDNLPGYSAARLECVKFSDPDQDMSGAVIWAVGPGEGPESTNLVNIAAAWGQDPSKSGSGDNEALDLGTVIPPMLLVQVSETVKLTTDENGDGLVNPGDKCTYTITIKNTGQRDYEFNPSDIASINKVPLVHWDQQTYVPNSCNYHDGKTTNNSGGCNAEIQKTATQGGFPNPFTLVKRGGLWIIEFDVVIDSIEAITKYPFSDEGILIQPGVGPDLPYSAGLEIHFNPDIDIQKTVHLGNKATCSDGSEEVTGAVGDQVTYCYKITNTGGTYLKNFEVTDPGCKPNALPTDGLDGANLAPNGIKWVKYVTTIPDNGNTSLGKVVAEAAFNNGDLIDSEHGGGTVTDEDPAGVLEVTAPLMVYTPGIRIQKTVHMGNQHPTCFTGEELVYGVDGTPVTYCYEVFNDGDEILVGVKVGDPPTNPSFTCNIGTIGIGESKWCPTQNKSTITEDKKTDGKAEGTGTTSGTPVNGLDDAAVKIVVKTECA
jgi:hypothetical protein